MNTRLKVTIRPGQEEAFLRYCDERGIDCRQYANKAMQSCFGAWDNPLLRGFDGIESIVDMPIARQWRGWVAN